MREFFRGWKRKVGVVTLGFACLLTGLCFRSDIMADEVELFWFSPTRVTAVSSERSVFILVDRSEVSRLLHRKGTWLGMSYRSTQFKFSGGGIFARTFMASYLRYSQRREICGVGIASEADDEGNIQTAFRVSLWWLVILGTLLSTYLLLSKPRTAKATTMSEPKPIEAP